jgi:L-2-hydroxyglutarate oxidase LhgO
MPDIDALVVGAGVVGIAVARALALSGRSVIVIERADGIGSETSSRNSEVIHSGIYYPRDTLKAKPCIAGRQKLYEFSAERGVPHRRCGKLIVAADKAELAAIEALALKGEANGVDDLKMLSAAEAKAMEPALNSVGALLAPSTGIIDSHAFMLALQGEAEDSSRATFAFLTPFVGARLEDDGFAVETGGAEPMRLKTTWLINAAGLSASRVASAIDGLNRVYIPQTRYAKGNYFALAGRAPFTRLIYPAPQTHGLGVHLTLDLAGRACFGPDVEWVDEISYDVDPRRSEGFADAIRKYWPGLPDDALAPGYSGIRPKLGGPSDPVADFRIDGPERHGIPGLVNLFGVESPGLTASLAIAERVVAALGD